MTFNCTISKTLFQDRSPKAVFFDLDGTLIDSALDLSMGINQMLEHFHMPSESESLIRQWVGKGAETLVRKALNHAAIHHLNQPVESVLVEYYDTALAYFIDAYEACNGQSARPFPGVIKSLEFLSSESVPMAVVTNKLQLFAQPLLEQMDMDHFFEFLVSGDSVSNKKPHPDSIILACQMAEAQPETVLMVGDSMNDVQAARAAGCPVIAVDYGYNHGVDIRESSPDMVVSSMTDVFHANHF